MMRLLGTERLLLGSAVVLAAAGLGGTAAGTGADARRPRRPGVSSRSARAASCSATRSRRPARFVGPYGLRRQGRPRRADARVRPRRRSTRQGRERATPQQGVDYSGTNVQEQGVDEPDIVKTNGKTLFALANGQLNAVDVTRRASRASSTRCTLDGGWSHELLLYGDRLLVLSRGGYWARAAAGDGARRMIAVRARRSRCSPRSTSRTRARCASSARSRSTAPTSPRASSAATVRIVASSQVPATLPFVQPQSATDGRARRGRDAATAPSRLVARRELAAVLPHQARRARGRRRRARSSSAATSAARRRSRASGC